MPLQTKYPVPNVSVDVALFTLVEGRLCVLLNRRLKEPYENAPALPGGYVHEQEDESTEDTARRVLRDKVGITAPYIEQLRSFSGKFRDPRGWSLSVAYYAVIPETHISTDGKSSILVAVDALPDLPFDHRKIIEAGVTRLRNKSSYSSLPMFLLPGTFTLRELLDVYECVMGISVDLQTFRRRMEVQNMIVPVEGAMRKGQHRPAQLYAPSDAGISELRQPLTS